MQEGNERQVEKACATLAETRRALYGILAEDTDATAQDTDATAPDTDATAQDTDANQDTDATA